MGNLTAKTSGEIATFMTPAKTNIKSLKVHFSPKQLGTGDPSPENIREIVGWDGVETFGSGRNLIDESFLSNADNYSNVGSYGYKYTDYIQLVPNTKYCFTWFDIDDSNMKECHLYVGGASEYIVDNGTHRQYPNGFTTNDTGKVRFGINKSSYSTNQEALDDIFSHGKLLLQIGTETISYEPYQGNNISYQWKLPDEYQEVEYIESTGTQHIDTLINLLSNDFKIECKFELLSNKNVEQPLFSIWTSTYSYWNCFVRQNNYNNAIDVYTGSHHSFGSVALNDVKSVFLQRISNTWSLTYDGTNIEWNYTPTKINDITLKLFKRGDLNRSSSIRIYNFKLDINNIESLNLIPCYRKSDNEIGMYDTISQTFYTNQGTGTFLKGEDVDKTIYGGYVDLISGELKNTYGIYTFEENGNYEYRAGSVTYVIPTVLDMKTGDFYTDQYVVCDRAKKVLSRTTAVNNELQIKIGNNNNRAYLYNTVGTIGIDNETDFRQWIKDNPISFTYPLATPITHQLTPTQLQSFIGQNNFWSNADYVEIEYDLIETEDIQKCRKKIMLNQPHTESVIGNIASFTTNMKAPLKECKVYFNPIQEGSGDPSPDNIRNIIGWNGVEVNGCGKNLWNNEDIIYGYWTDGNGKQTVNQRGCRTQYIYVTSNITIQLFYYGVQPYSASIIELNYNKEFIKRTHMAWEGTTNPKSLTITTSNETRYIYAQTYIYTSSSSNKMTYDLLCSYKMQMEFNTITSYEPYKGNIYSEDWSSEVGTVYGGYVDLAKGELVAEWIKKSISSFTWTYNSTGICFRTLTNIKNKSYGVISPVLSNIYKTTNVGNTMAKWANYDDFSISEYIGVDNSGNRKDAIHIKDSRYTTVPDFLNGVGNESIIYELAEPIHYSLTPQQLLTFKGENNIWSNTNGQTEVKFWTH